jgi:capsular polysaccharide biosynthesis protein
MQDLTKENFKENESKKREREVEIDFLALLRTILKRLWLIILVGLICGGIMFCIAEFVVQPTYRSGFSAFVNNKQGQNESQQITNNDINASHQLVATYSTIITSREMLMGAIEEDDNTKGTNLRKYSYSKLKSMVKINMKDDTGVMEVNVISPNQNEALQFANAIAKKAPEYMAYIVEGSSMKIIDMPAYPNTKYAPSTSKYTILGILVGALIMLIIVIISYFTNDTLSGESDLEQHYNLPIIGVIPDYTKVGKGEKGGYYSYGYAYRLKSSDKDKEDKKRG